MTLYKYAVTLGITNPAIGATRTVTRLEYAIDAMDAWKIALVNQFSDNAPGDEPKVMSITHAPDAIEEAGKEEAAAIEKMVTNVIRRLSQITT